MSDIKSDFREWLQKNFSKSTAYSYYALVQKIFDKNFDDSQDWQKHSESIMPLLVRYFEFANREYSLDRVTIWYALDYFDKITDFIGKGNLKEQEENVKISIFDGNKFYPVCSIRVSQLYDAVLIIRTYLFNVQNNLKPKNENTPVDIVKLSTLLLEIETTSVLKDLKDAAIHIIYDNKNISAEKTALSRYCDFLYSVTSDPAFYYKGNPVVNMATTKSPNNMIGGNYYINQPISGKQPLQIKINDPSRVYYHDDNDIPDFILIVSDMVDILHIDRKSIVKHFVDKEIIKNMQPDAEKIEKKYGIAKDKTVLRDYFSLSSTNEFLKDSHHSIYNKSRPVNYDKEGYDYWISQSEAVKELAVSRNAFYNLVTENNCSYIDYIKGYPRYYSEDIKYLITRSPIVAAQRRKNIYLRKNKKIKTN